MNPTPDQPTGMNELRELIIEALDDYHEGGEFHEYTPLEKQRHADGLIQEFQQLVERCIPEKRTGDIRFGTRGERTFHESDYDQGCNYALAKLRHNLQQAGLLRGGEEQR